LVERNSHFSLKAVHRRQSSTRQQNASWLQVCYRSHTDSCVEAPEPDFSVDDVSGIQLAVFPWRFLELLLHLLLFLVMDIYVKRLSSTLPLLFFFLRLRLLACRLFDLFAEVI
jgi:hypothetical protein